MLGEPVMGCVAARLLWEAILRLVCRLAVVSDLTPSRYKLRWSADSTASVFRAPEDFSASNFSNSDADLIGSHKLMHMNPCTTCLCTLEVCPRFWIVSICGL